MQREIAEILRSELKDPRVASLVTITGVELSPDLAHARVFFTVLGDEATIDGSVQGLRSAAGFVRTALSRRMRLRIVPQIGFEYDESVVRGVALSALIDQANSSVPSEDATPGQESKPS